MTQNKALIQRLQEAMEGSRELDCAIARAFDWTYNRDVEYCWRPPSESALKVSFQSIPAFSTSIDAAMTLVPEGFWLHLSSFTSDIPERGSVHLYGNRGLGDDYPADAATPALALCIAALSAKEDV